MECRGVEPHMAIQRMANGLELKAKQKMIQFFSSVQTVIAEGKKIEG